MCASYPRKSEITCPRGHQPPFPTISPLNGLWGLILVSTLLIRISSDFEDNSHFTSHWHADQPLGLLF
ncbi:hypothetical protein AAHC03_05530 [Spirometra sp. Aus1]